MKKIGIIILLLGLMSCHKHYITDGYYQYNRDLMRVVKDSVYLLAMYGGDELASGFYKIQRNKLQITMTYPGDNQYRWPQWRWDYKKKVWMSGRGRLKHYYYKQPPLSLIHPATPQKKDSTTTAKPQELK